VLTSSYELTLIARAVAFASTDCYFKSSSKSLKIAEMKKKQKKIDGDKSFQFKQ
jgi:hypothetical protein